MISGERLPWRRFWVPAADGKISAGHDGQGFLDNPEGSFGRAMNPELRTIDELLGRSCLVLSGQPGIGKSTEVDALVERSAEWLAPDERLIAFHCRALVSEESLRRETVEAPAWKKTLAEGGRVRLLMDGVDEALQRVSVLVPALARWLRHEPCERVRVILVCRAAEWHEADADALRALWPQEQGPMVYELCPLRWEDASLAATADGVDPDAFWRELLRHNLRSLAARPLTLRLLLAEMRGGGALPSGHHELFRGAILRMCQEHDEERSRHLPSRPRPEHVARVAARIAALLMLGGRSVVARGEADAVPDELPMAEIARGHETVGTERFEVSEALVRATLDTPLFSFRGPDRYGFDQAAFGEHLAADYLGDLPVSQLRRLLCVRAGDREQVAPQLSEVAAWVAINNEAWRDALIDSEPELLLRADLSRLDDATKGRAVAAFLARAEREEAFDSQGTDKFYPSLAHPGLAEQLRRYIHDPSHNLVVRRMAFEIAGDARVAELEPDIWQRVAANDPCLNSICHALADLAGPHSIDDLLRALHGELPDNEMLDLRGMALKKLVPEIMPVREAVPHLIPQPRENYTGAYRMTLLFHLPTHLTVADLPGMFAWMQRQPRSRRLHDGDKLAARAVELALENVFQPKVLELLGRYWKDRARIHGRLPGRSDRQERDPWAALADAEVRRSLVRCVLTLPDAQATDITCFTRRLVTGEDLVWLLETLPSIPTEHRRTWALTCAHQICQELPAVAAPLLVQRHADFSELREVLPAASHHDIATTIMRLRRARELRSERRQQYEERHWPTLTRGKCIAQALRAAGQGDTTAWVRFCGCAGMEDEADAKRETPRDHLDVTDSPAWEALDASQHAQLRAAAKRFLAAHRDGPRTINQWSHFADAAVKAICLLWTGTDADAELRTTITERWPRVVFDQSDYGSAKLRPLVASLHQIVPEVGEARLAARLHHDNRENGHLSGIDHYDRVWDAGLSKIVRDFLLSRRVKPAFVRRTLEFLAERDRPAALTVFDELIACRSGGFRPLDARGRALLAVGLFTLTAERWTISWKTFARCKVKTARTVYLESSQGSYEKKESFVDLLSTAQLVGLCALVCRIFPSDEYFERSAPDGNVTEHHRIPAMREGLISLLVGRATEEACAGLRRLAEQLPPSQRIWMRWRHREAVNNLLRKSWTARRRSSADILAMARDPLRQTVDSADDLLDAVLASLESLQRRLLVAESPQLRSLWNDGRGDEPPSPKMEAVLSDTVADWLRHELGQGGIVLNREVEATRLGRIDIKVQTPARPGLAEFTVAVEVKGEWNRDVANSLGKQLARQYLVANEWTHGVYLVGWFGGRKQGPWHPKTFSEAQENAQRWASEQTPGGLTIQTRILDCSLGGIAARASRRRAKR